MQIIYFQNYKNKIKYRKPFKNKAREYSNNLFILFKKANSCSIKYRIRFLNKSIKLTILKYTNKKLIP